MGRLPSIGTNHLLSTFSTGTSVSRPIEGETVAVHFWMAMPRKEIGKGLIPFLVVRFQ